MFARLHPFADIVLALFLVLGIDLVAFHGRLYHRWLSPDSYSGRVERTARRFEFLSATSQLRQIVVLGDSTAAHCIGEQIVEAKLSEAGWPLGVANLSLGGSTARSIYHLLRHSDLDAGNTALVVIGVHPMGMREVEDKPDIKILKTRLDVVDLLTLPSSYEKLETRFQVATGIVFRGLLFREDLLEFARSPRQRLAAVEGSRREERELSQAGWRRVNQSRRNLLSARLGADGRLDLATLEPWIRQEAELIGRLESLLRRKADPSRSAPPMVIEEPQAELLKKAVRLLAGRGIPVVLAVTPEGPWPLPGHPAGPLETLVAELKAEGLAVKLFRPADTLDVVERPEHFKDLLHANAAGARVYSEALGTFLNAAFESSELKIEERRRSLRGEEQGDPKQTGDQQGPHGQRQAVEEDE